MQIPTTRFGLLQLKEETFIHFPWGLPGFETLRRYVFLEHGNGPFHWLQSVDDPSVAFLVCSPEVHGLSYQVPRSRLEKLKLENPRDLAILNMVSLEREENTVRFHIRSPLLFNTLSRTAHQWNMEPHEMRKHIVPPAQLNHEDRASMDFIVWRLNGREKGPAPCRSTESSSRDGFGA